MNQTFNNNKAKASSPAKAGKAIGESFDHFCTCCDADPSIKLMMSKWINDKFINSTDAVKTATGRVHKIIRKDSKKFIDDVRVVVPKSEENGKGKDGNGLRSKLLAQGFDQEKITLTWPICYVNNIRIPAEKPTGWQHFECSHTCCEYDEGGKRIKDARCIDPQCLTWESKSTNQERANKACRRLCHCGCGKTLCEANGIHEPCCR